MEKRGTVRSQPTDKQLYKRNLSRSISREKRTEELKRLLEIKEQKKVWLTTVLLCAILNVLFVTLAFVGWYYEY